MANGKTRANRPKALLRYFVIATIIVLAVVGAIAGYVNRDFLAIKIKSVYVPVSPKPAQGERAGKRNAPAVMGDAPWALSALPECFSQTSKSTAPTQAYVLAHLPKGSLAAQSGTTLYYADCKLRVKAETVYVDRGADRLRIPPPSRLFYDGSQHVALLRGTEAGYELRVYAAAAGGPGP